VLDGDTSDVEAAIIFFYQLGWVDSVFMILLSFLSFNWSEHLAKLQMASVSYHHSIDSWYIAMYIDCLKF